MYSQKKKKFTYYGKVVSKASDQPTCAVNSNNNIDSVKFPDNFNSFLPQSKKPKVEKVPDHHNDKTLDYKQPKVDKITGLQNDKPVDSIKCKGLKEEKSHVVTNTVNTVNNDLILQDDLMDDDDFYLTQAADEIDQIEIMASQRVPVKPPKKTVVDLKMNMDDDHDILDELLSGNSKIIPQNRLDMKKENKFNLKLPKKKPLPNSISENGDGSSTHVTEKKFTHNGLLKDEGLHPKSEKRKFDATLDAPSSTITEEIIRKRNEELKSKKEKENMELLNSYKSKMLDAEQKYFAKDGEIKILRETLRKQSDDERKYKERIQGLEHDLKTQQTDKEAKLIAEVEKLKTQLTFKEKEVQDATEKHKKMLKENAKESGNTSKVSTSHRKSPKVGFYSDAFEKSEKAEKTSISSNKCKDFIPKKSSNRCKFFKETFDRNILELSPTKEVKYENLDISGSFGKLNLKCKHKHDDENGIVGNTDFSRNLQLSFQMVELDRYFVPEFIVKLNKYMGELYDLLQMEVQDGDSRTTRTNVEVVNKIKVRNRNDCRQCRKIYEDGLQSFIHCTSAPSAIKEYLLDGLVKHLGQELVIPSTINTNINVKLHNKDYFVKYSDLTQFLLVKEKTYIDRSRKKDRPCVQFDDALDFWKLINQFILLDGQAQIEKVMFIFLLSLPSYPLQDSCDHFASYLIDHQLISKHLNIITIDRILNVLRMLQKLSGLKSVTNLMCNKSDRCPLLLIYNWLIDEDVATKEQKIMKVFHELVSLLSSVISYDQVSAYKCLLESDCRCSGEIIEFFITFLFDEFKYLQQKVFLTIDDAPKLDSVRLAYFRQGMSLLCLLCSNEKKLEDKRSAVEWNYIHLLFGSIEMYRKIPSVNDKEVIDLEDLLDIDQQFDIDVPIDKVETKVEPKMETETKKKEPIVVN